MPQANATPRAAATTVTSISRRFSSPISDAAPHSRANFRAATEIAPAKCRTTSALPATDPPDKNASSSIFSSFASGSARTVAVKMPRAECPSNVTSSFSSHRKRRPPARTWTFPSIRRAISESWTITEILRPPHKKGNARHEMPRSAGELARRVQSPSWIKNTTNFHNLTQPPSPDEIHSMAESQSPPRWRAAPLILALFCGLISYSNSFRGPFIFDDIDAIQNNPAINRSLNDTSRANPTTLSGRPVLFLTFAIDEAIAGMHVEIYHATNLLIHLACGSLLFGIVRRNLLCQNVWGSRFQISAPWLAGAVTALWLAHPLNTQAVTYIVQRAESLAGFFYLAVIYCLIRDAEKPSLAWKLSAVTSCALGMATKESMATAPLVALLYDRTFLSGSVLAALKKRASLYIGLAATWAILAAIILGGARAASVGFKNISALDYARTQLNVIAHYVSLSLWPGNLTLDYYDWPIARNWTQITPGGWIVALGLLFFIAAFWLKPRLGFLGAWFFLTLAPSSSIIPIFTEIAAEQRMYLPLIAIISLIVIGAWTWFSRTKTGRSFVPLMAAFLIAILAVRTMKRNAEYRSPVTIWADNVAERPLNPRAHFNLGYSLLIQNNPAAAIPEFRAALDIAPDYYAAARLLGRALHESASQAATRPIGNHP
jgi:protein O-mannosyl-transferase